MGEPANCDGLAWAILHEVPAFEVFADRQPVEWGLTEVIEHSLVSQDDSIDSVVIGWLMS